MTNRWVSQSGTRPLTRVGDLTAQDGPGCGYGRAWLAPCRKVTARPAPQQKLGVILAGVVSAEEITAAAAGVSATGGFEAVTLERLSADLGVRERAVSEHFATDDLLQQSIVWAGADVFNKAVTEPAGAAPDGIERLRALLSYWVDYAESDAYRGGFVGGAADLPGHIGDLIARIARSWIETLAEHARLAVERGDLPPGTDPHQVAFEVHGLVQEANWTFGVLGDRNAYNRARAGIEHRIGR